MTGQSGAAVNADEKARERFERDTAEHRMTVMHDDGVYRHLRFQKPGSWTYGYDIVTWPGFLALTGDMGEYLFARIADMFKFFEHGDRINPGYWGEKLQGPGRDLHLQFSEEAFSDYVRGWLDEETEPLSADEARALREAVQFDVLGEPADEHEAVRRMNEFEFAGHRFYDPWDHDLREFDGRFLWCCWAIVRGIERYRKAVSS